MTDPKPVKIKECPFCGGEASLEKTAQKPARFTIGCIDENCRGYAEISIYQNAHDAIDGWDRRAS